MRQPVVHILHQDASAYRSEINRRCVDAQVEVLLSEAEFESRIGEIEVLLTAQCPVEPLSKARKLRWIQITNAGVDFLSAAEGQLGQLTVTNARGIHGDLMSDYVFAVIGSHQWDMPGLWRDHVNREWHPRYVEPLHRKVMCVIGLGSIGARIAQRAKSTGMTVLGVRRRQGEPVNGVDEIISHSGIGDALARCDYLVIAVPSTGETRKLIDAPALACMQRSAYLINIARGDVVDEEALIDALERGTIAGAALDVCEQEPLPRTSPLWGLKNVLITPHISGNTAGYVSLVTHILIENLCRYVRGQRLINQVDVARGY
jgi:phosphoglycerate dehydrogenase-like enzyme